MDIRFLSRDRASHMIKVSNDFMVRSFTKYVTNVPSFVAIGAVIVVI